MDRGAWGGYSPSGHKELDTTERLTHTQAEKETKCASQGTVLNHSSVSQAEKQRGVS